MLAAASLWAGVVAIGVYHGLNPAMGWPLAVANGLERRRARAVLATWMPLGAGHLCAMALVLVPFAMLTWMLAWGRELRLGAGALVLLFGLWRLVRRRHPRWLARVRPTQVAWWSFLMATAHGAALMLVPFLLGLCATDAGPGDAGAMGDHAATMRALGTGLAAAVGVALVHTTAMIASGLGVAWAVFRSLGLQVLRRAWLDLDAVWALGLIVSGAAAMFTAWHATAGFAS
jgi:hypothetical protein